MRDDRLTKFFVLTFGLYQVGHLLSNLRGAFIFFGRGELPFPAMPPPGGFDPQLVSAYLDMAVMDSTVAVISLVFVWGYFTGKPWRLWLGSMTLTLSFYAGILFNLTVYQAGAWTGDNLILYLLINIIYLPVIVLWVQVLRWSFKYLRE
jgi:hypothetical protein